MRFVIRRTGKEWWDNFAAVVQIDDRFGELYRLAVLQEHMEEAITEAVKNVGDPFMILTANVARLARGKEPVL